jgi:hypothetical protein
MNPVWYTNNEQLVPVFNRNGFKCITHPKEVDLSDAVQCMAMYLPILLDLDKHELWDGAYLTSSEEYRQKWEKLLPDGKKLVCKWSGNPHYEQDLHRSIPLNFIHNIKFDGKKINVQLEPELSQTGMFSAGCFINNIEDTLAIIDLCDGVVTSCTSVAHMVGALGKNGIVCPPIASYYIWLGMNGNKSDWYGENLKVFRQNKHKDWACVFENVQKTIRENNG